MTTVKAPYHHGDLAAALLGAAMEIVDEGGAGDLSLRAVARRAGVSAAAPYRHYADREALVSAIAAVGYEELAVRLIAASPAPASAAELVAVAVAYVQFAIERPALFRIMFSEPCDRDNDVRVAATQAIDAYLTATAVRVAPDADPEAMGTAIWALVHGLAFLHLDGKLQSDDPAVVTTRVGATVTAALAGFDTQRS